MIADSEGQPLSASQFLRLWKYVTVRTTKPRNYYKHVNGHSIKYTVTPTLDGHQKTNPKLIYAIDFDVTSHQLRHTYITNLLYAGCMLVLIQRQSNILPDTKIVRQRWTFTLR